MSAIKVPDVSAGLKSGKTLSILGIVAVLVVGLVGAWIYDKITTKEITITDANGNVSSIGKITTRIGSAKKKPENTTTPAATATA